LRIVGDQCDDRASNHDLVGKGSSSMPIVVIWRVCGKIAVEPSVIEANTKRTEATISCARSLAREMRRENHKRSGIMTIRLIVIEFGKFIVSPYKSIHRSS